MKSYLIMERLISSFPGVEYDRLHHRHLEWNKVNALRRCDGNFEAKMSLTQNSLIEFQWWIKHVKTACRQIRHGPPDLILFTDYPKTGEGLRLTIVMRPVAFV